MSFRIGRSAASHFYPESPRGSSVPTEFARNFAAGPTGDTLVIGGDGTQIPWSVIDVGGPGTDVPITPQSTGIIRITAVVVIGNTSTDPQTVGIVQISALIDGVTPVAVPIAEQFSIDINGFKSIQLVAETPALPVGVTATIQILATLIAGTLVVVDSSSTVEVQEVSAATG